MGEGGQLLSFEFLHWNLKAETMSYTWPLFSTAQFLEQCQHNSIKAS